MYYTPSEPAVKAVYSITVLYFRPTISIFYIFEVFCILNSLVGYPGYKEESENRQYDIFGQL